MTDRFVQVETGLPRSRLVDRARTVLALSRACAVGHLTLLWLAVMETGCSGRLDDRSDLWIEDAAGWTGEPGAFARFIREHHLTDGVITDWKEKYALVDEARERNKQRMRRTRKSHGADTVRAQNRNVSDTPLSSPSLAVVVEGANPTEMLVGRDGPADPLDRFGDRLAKFGEFEDEVRRLLRASADAETLLRALEGHVAKEEYTHAQVGQAVRDVLANGERFNSKRFRVFLQSIKQPRASAVAGVIAPADALADLRRALDWSKSVGGYRRITAEAYAKAVPLPIRKALGACGGIKAFEEADAIGLRALEKRFVTEWQREAAHASR